MGDPKDDRTEALREVSPKAPGSDAPVDGAPTTMMSSVPAQSGTGQSLRSEAGVDSATTVVGTVPAKPGAGGAEDDPGTQPVDAASDEPVSAPVASPAGKPAEAPVHCSERKPADVPSEPAGDAPAGELAPADGAAAVASPGTAGDASADEPGDVAAAPNADSDAPAEPVAGAPPTDAPAAAETPAEAPAPAGVAAAAVVAPPPAAPRATPVRFEPNLGRWPTPEPATGGRPKRRLILIGAAVAVVLLGLGGWALTLTHGSLKGVPEIIAPSAPKVTVAYLPGPGPDLVSPTTPVSVTATDGELRDVALTAPGVTAVQGELSPDRRTWTVTQPLAYGTTYTWAGTAADAANETVPLAGTVMTVKPKKVARGTINIPDGRVVGIAAPIVIQFSGRVTDRAAVERSLKVETSVPTEGSWAWFQDEGGGSRIHWRPRVYFQPGTRVTVTAPLFGVDYGAGVWGAANVSTSFTIGRSQIVKADVNSYQMVVMRDGAQVAKFPASYGLDSDPNRNTRSGIHVVTEKLTDKRMISQQYNYDVVVKWAVRMSNNGEFIHANPATTGVQGSRNVSHGCVNLSTANAKQYYDSVLYGDPVEVTGSGVQLSAKDGDFWDWTLSWDQWTGLSALNRS